MTSTYKTGTAAVTNGSVNVVGTGTAWAVALVVGGMFSCNGLSVPIASIVDDTHLTLDYNWPGATGSGQSYSILRENSDAANIVDLTDKLTQILIDLSLAGIHPNNSGSLAKRDALTLTADNDGYLYLQAELGVAFAFYRWDGPSLAWVGPFPVASAVTAAAGVQSIVAGTNVTIDNTNPNIPVINATAPDLRPLNNTWTGNNTWQTGLNTFKTATTFNLNAAALPAAPSGTIAQFGGADATVARLLLDSFGTGGTNFTFRASLGTAAARSALTSGSVIGTFGAMGAYDATNYVTSSRAAMAFVAAENWSATNQGARIDFYTTPLASTTQKLAGSINPDGSLTINQNAAALPAPPNGTGLQVGGVDGTGARILADTFGTQASFTGRRANGTAAARSALVSGDIIGTFGAHGAYDATNYSNANRAMMQTVATENWAAGAQGAKVQFSTTPNGGTTTAVVLTIDRDGGLQKVGAGQTSLKRVGILGGNPVTSGTTDPNQFMVAGNENVDWSFGFYGSGAMWAQPRGTANYSVNYNSIFNPNGGNVGIGATGQSPTSKLTVAGAIATAVPTIQTTNYTVSADDDSVIFNGSGTITATLPAAASYPGRWLTVKTITAQAVNSASSNVKPLASNTAGTAILAATAGKWALLRSDGTNWVIMAGN
ncbi:hypothetical protein EOA32_00980 [Mesorhizobium sp. M1A.F.Ca.ET.072.01.1.1]|uniref:hypothetical protein n=1 Tax=Mesorhizobium sp. M1A.F.Ca.ET.072.01.1.1 TaxID=2496753 RepID=UPI000FD4508A|nr:hypothetical protein [Mesorhizobium sp. M1A.F.Ca.ET.072.01.1.1]RUW55623.1 hypothetical protein EOA32_00980 [Mesorhizobium sp. M1A.F.Ca.ET.072.01.1.1]